MKQLLLLIIFLAGAFFGLSAFAGPKEGDFVSVKQFGATGDGATDDTAAIQLAVDAVGKTGGTLLFPPGIYVVTSVGLRPGVRYLGYGATIKRPAGQGKWTRTFNAAAQGYLYSGDKDSAPITVEGLTFDGNREAQGDYRKYQLEQAHLLFLAADRKRAGRLRARILNCHFRDNVADAISLYTNVDVRIINSSARDCFRGGITITGGYSRVHIQNFTAEGKVHPTGIDVEVDGAGFGDSKKIELIMNGLSLPDGDFDLGVSDGSIVLGTNIIARAPFNLYGRDSTVRISNSVFGVGRYSAKANRIVYPGDVTFQNCQFQIDGKSDPAEKSKWSAIHLYWNVGGGKSRGQSLKLLDCDFTVKSGIADQDDTYAVYCEGDVAERNNRLLVEGGSISSAFDFGVMMKQGGSVQVREVAIEAQTAMVFGSAEKWPINALIDGVRIGGAKCYAVIPTHLPENRFTHRNVEIDESVNVIETKYGIAGNQFIGRRIILGGNPPGAVTHGLKGDVFRLRNPLAGKSYEWICVKSGTGKVAVWKALSKVGE